jgi:hypothetical protein
MALFSHSWFIMHARIWSNLSCLLGRSGSISTRPTNSSFNVSPRNQQASSSFVLGWHHIRSPYEERTNFGPVHLQLQTHDSAALENTSDPFRVSKSTPENVLFTETPRAENA